MPRSRYLKPGFFKNDVLATLRPSDVVTATPAASFAVRLCFEGLWTLADREGRVEDRPKRIRVDIFPYDEDVNVDALLTALASAGFIRRYTVDGQRVIQITNFLKHQNPHFKEPASTLPAAVGHKDSKVRAFGVPAEQRARIMERDGYKCQKCGAGDKLTIDHIKARSRGGSGDDDNLRVLCVRCNSSKGNRLEKHAATTRHG